MNSKPADTILILEDDAGVARLGRLRWNARAIIVTVASTTEQAIEQIEQGHVDLVLLDYRLPGEVNGLDFYRTLRSSGIDVPSVLVTGYSDRVHPRRSPPRRDSRLPPEDIQLPRLSPLHRRAGAQASADRARAPATRAEVAMLVERAAPGSDSEAEAKLRFALDAAQLSEWDLDLATDTARRSWRHDQAFGYREPVERWGFAILAPARPPG